MDCSGAFALQDGPALALDLLGSCFTDQLRPPLLTPGDIASYLKQQGVQVSSSRSLTGNADVETSVLPSLDQGEAQSQQFGPAGSVAAAGEPPVLMNKTWVIM